MRRLPVYGAIVLLLAVSSGQAQGVHVGLIALRGGPDALARDYAGVSLGTDLWTRGAIRLHAEGVAAARLQPITQWRCVAAPGTVLMACGSPTLGHLMQASAGVTFTPSTGWGLRPFLRAAAGRWFSPWVANGSFSDAVQENPRELASGWQLHGGVGTFLPLGDRRWAVEFRAQWMQGPTSGGLRLWDGQPTVGALLRRTW